MTTTSPVHEDVPTDSWPIYSCDDHLDLRTVPADVWQARVSSKIADLVPKVVPSDAGPMWLCGDRPLGRSGGGVLGNGESAITRAGIEDDGFRASDPVARLADMDLDGVYASVIYGPNLFGLPIPDPAVKAQAWRAWNDWAAEFNGHAPERLAALAVLPTTGDAETAVAELQRVAALGHRGALLYSFEMDLADRKWDPLWAAAAETGLPLSFHIGGGVSIVPQFDSWQVAAFSAVVPMQLDEPLAVVMFSGVLERHPGLKIVLAESGAGWVPYFISRMDGVFDKYQGRLGGHELKTRPSELFDRQVWATFEEERFGPAILPLVGAHNFMWASDYPHLDSTFPNSRHAIHEALGALSMADRKKVTADTCKELYRF
jgi:predicted TIM-barrel fold metal-dependent hydrolase